MVNLIPTDWMWHLAMFIVALALFVRYQRHMEQGKKLKK